MTTLLDEPHTTEPGAVPYDEMRILIWTPVGRDAELTQRVLGEHEIAGAICQNVEHLCELFAQGAGAAIIAEEALSSLALQRLTELLSRQPSWSDFPLLILTQRGPDSPAWGILESFLPPTIATLLERPLRILTLVSAVRVALRGRRRQYEIRDHLLARERYADALRESEARFRSMADAAPTLIWITDADGRPLYFNRRWLEMTGETFEQQAHGGWSRAVHPEDLQQRLACYEESAEHHASFQCEYRIQRNDGQYRWLFERAVPRLGGNGEFLGYIGSCVDITDRRTVEEALRRSEEQVRSITDSLPVYIASVDSNERYTFNNAAYEKRFGIPREQMNGRTIREITGDEAYRRSWPYIRRALSGDEVNFEYEMPGDHNTNHYYHASYTPILNNGNPDGFHILITDITERRRNEEERRRLAAIVESSPDAIYAKDLDGTIRSWNDGAVRMFGYSAEEIVGKNVSILAAPDRKEDVLRIMERLRLGEESRALETRRVRKDGRLIDVSLTVSPLHAADGSVVGAASIARDISEQKQADQNLRASEARFRGTFENGAVGIAHIGVDGQWLRVNQKLCDILGYSRPELLKTTFQDTTQHRGELQLAEFHTLLDKGRKSLSLERPFWKRDGSAGWMLLTVSLEHNVPNEDPYFIAFLEDISGRKEAEQRLKDLNDTLEQRIAQRTRTLIRHQKQLRRLASELTLAEQRERRRVSVELHDHLAQLLVACKLKKGQLERAVTGEKGKHHLNDIDEMLDTALQYTRTLIAELSPTVLYESGLGAAVDWVAEQMKTHGLQVRVMSEGTEERLPDDQAILLYQAIREVLFNSVKHARCENATVFLKWLPDVLQISIEDYGVGFDVKSISENSATNGQFGLFTVRERMEALDSRFRIISSPGNGTRIEMAVPLKEPESSSENGADTTPPVTPAVSKDGALKTGDRLRVMLVDDHEMVRQGLRNIIESVPDFVVVGEASNGREAVDFVDEMKPEVIVMDVNMPKMNGIEATRRIKEKCPEIAIIGLSVHEDSGVAAVMKEAGASFYLTKGGHPSELYEALRATRSKLGKRRAGRAETRGEKRADGR